MGIAGAAGLYAILTQIQDRRNGKPIATPRSWDGGSWAGGRSRPSEQASMQLVKGIKNLGNTCFLNAVLQSLGSFPVFREYLEDLKVSSLIYIS